MLESGEILEGINSREIWTPVMDVDQHEPENNLLPHGSFSKQQSEAKARCSEAKIRVLHESISYGRFSMSNFFGGFQTLVRQDSREGRRNWSGNGTQGS